MRVLATIVLAACLSAALAATAAAQPAQGRCPQGDKSATCFLWTGKVTFIGDGDTMSVDVDGDGTKKPVRVRLTGYNSPEQTYYTNRPEDRVGECHANEATSRLESLIRAAKGRVQLAAIDPESRSRGRIRRAVSIKLHRNWRDIGRIMVQEGHGLFLSARGEWAWNRAYSTLAQQAKLFQVGIWNPEFCAPGPLASIRLWVQGDPEGADAANLNGEWVRIKNLDPVNPLPVGGWRVRDSGLRGYLFPPHATIPPGTTMTVYTGSGVETPTDLFWGLSNPVYDSIRPDRATGDGAYLFDADGDMRASMQYPCRYLCRDRYEGDVAVDPAYKRANEFITLRNRSDEPVDLEGYRVASKPYSYVFGGGNVLQPGTSMRLYVKGDPAADTSERRYWGKTKAILKNSGDRVDLTTMDRIQIGCAAWGTKSC
jgi:endonuclease YncB( thermonuclease family)